MASENSTVLARSPSFPRDSIKCIGLLLRVENSRFIREKPNYIEAWGPDNLFSISLFRRNAIHEHFLPVYSFSLATIVRKIVRLTEAIEFRL